MSLTDFFPEGLVVRNTLEDITYLPGTPLYTDAEIVFSLLPSSHYGDGYVNWSSERNICRWLGITVSGIDGESRITGIKIHFKLDETRMKRILPSRLKKLIIQFYRLPDPVAEQLGKILPESIEELDFKNSRLSKTGFTRLDLKRFKNLKSLNISNNNIGDVLSTLPPNLEKFYIDNIGITDGGIEKMLLPPRLIYMSLQENSNLTEKGIMRMRIPPSLRKLWLNDSISSLHRFSESEVSEALIWGHNKIEKYDPIKSYYDILRCKPIWKDICRGLIFGETEDPIFTFLKNIYGSRHIRRNIFEFFGGLLLQ